MLAVHAAIQVEPGEFLAVVTTAAVAGTLSVLVTARGLLVPAVVLELLLGVIIGPQVLGLEVTHFIKFFSDLGLAFGVFIPFFFVVSGMQLDIDALFASVSGVVKLFAFFGLFLVVRGTPALLLYRDVLDRRARLALACFSSTQLPLVLAITTLAQNSGHMRASTAASLVGAAVLSTLVYPMLGLRLRGNTAAEVPPAAVDLPGLAGGAR